MHIPETSTVFSENIEPVVATPAESIQPVAGVIATSEPSPVEDRTHRSLQEFARTKVGRVVATVTTAITFSGIGAVTEATPAQADSSQVYQVTGTENEGLYMQTSPSVDASSIELLSEGESVSVNCWTAGTNVLGDGVWDEVINNNGVTGYVADYYVNTPYITSTYVSGLAESGLPECGSENNGDSQPVISVDNNPNGDTISVPSNEAAAPWNYSTTSRHDLVDHVTWEKNPAGYGMTMEVFMTATGVNDARYDPNHAFSEAATDANLSHSSPYWNTLQSQFDCHAEIVAAVDSSKASWDLDTGRPDLGVVGDIAKECNPQ